MGGWMGLAIGASFFSFLEIGYFIVQLLKIGLNSCVAKEPKGRKRGPLKRARINRQVVETKWKST